MWEDWTIEMILHFLPLMQTMFLFFCAILWTQAALRTAKRQQSWQYSWHLAPADDHISMSGDWIIVEANDKHSGNRLNYLRLLANAPTDPVHRSCWEVWNLQRQRWLSAGKLLLWVKSESLGKHILSLFLGLWSAAVLHTLYTQLAWRNMSDCQFGPEIHWRPLCRSWSGMSIIIHHLEAKIQPHSALQYCNTSVKNKSSLS